MKKIELTKEQVDEILKLYNNNLLGAHSISKILGFSKSIILRILKENGISFTSSGRRFIGGKKVAEKKYRKKNKEKLTEYHKEWSKDKKDYLKKYIEEYRKQNKERIKEVKRIYQKHKRHTDPLYKLISNFRTAIYIVLKENNLHKYGHYFDVLGYTPNELIEHLEKQFIDGMNWENYGEWHIDHIRPISSFMFESSEDEEFKKCWSLENLQPMWGVENIRKGNKL
jgi:hypothetical protein